MLYLTKTWRVVCLGSSRQPPGLVICSNSITHHIVALTALSYYSDRMQSKINRGKGARGQVQRKPGTSFQGSSISGDTQDALNSPAVSVTTCVKCCQPGKLVRDSAPRVFIGHWPPKHPLPAMYQHSRLPEGKQVLSRNHVVCTVRAQ